VQLRSHQIYGEYKHANGSDDIDLHTGNVGISLPTLNEHDPHKILDYFEQPDCTIVLPKKQPAYPQALPSYLVSPISVIDYLAAKDSTFFETPHQAEIMDLGNG
jgi:hypothetical protein